MKCLSCGAEMTTRPENHVYSESGFSTVTLVNLEVSRCVSCGEHEIAIPAIEALHELISRMIDRERLRTTLRFEHRNAAWHALPVVA
ncbi:MAG: hypothetical protein JNK60_04015 [Acidobacteria bacterium]|nr:hypothetical protein [Acidobacteriota bacterium]